MLPTDHSRFSRHAFSTEARSRNPFGPTALPKEVLVRWFGGAHHEEHFCRGACAAVPALVFACRDDAERGRGIAHDLLSAGVDRDPARLLPAGGPRGADRGL